VTGGVRQLPGENLRKTGKEMEDLAAEYLSSRAVRILERNFRSREAEIDIIGQQDETLLFIEVKARKAGEKSGSGLEAVGAAKQKRICRCADFYMHEKGIDPFSTGIRFDVIAITISDDEEGSSSGKENCGVRWIRNAFSYISYSRTKPRWRVW
jgi:putative endonuclease